MRWSDRQKHVIRRSAIVTFGFLAVGLVVSCIVAGNLLSAQLRAIGVPAPDFPATSISVKSDSGTTIAGGHIESDIPKGVAVLLHPIRGSRLSMLTRAQLVHSAGYSIGMVDLQTHSKSPGTHITIGHLEKHDARAAVEFARQEHPN